MSYVLEMFGVLPKYNVNSKHVYFDKYLRNLYEVGFFNNKYKTLFFIK